MFIKTLKILTPLLLIAVIIIIAYNSYLETQDKAKSPITVIPTNASIIIQSNDIRDLSRTLKLSTIFDYLININTIENLMQETTKISEFFIKNQDIFKFNSLYISIHKASPNKSAILYSTGLTKTNKENQEIISLFANDIEISEYDNKTIYFSESLNKYFSIYENILFYSNSKMLLTDAIRTSNENTDNLFVNPNFSESYQTINKSENINIMINYNNVFEVSNIYSNKKLKKSNFSNWTASDLKFKNNAIISSGFSKTNQNIENFTDILSSQKSQEIKIINIIPNSTTQLFAISYDDPKIIFERKNKILQKQNKFWTWEKSRKIFENKSNFDYLDFINEIENEAGHFNTSASLNKNYSYTYFNTKESIRATSLLQEIITNISSYKDFNIYKIHDKNFTANLFGDFFIFDHPFFTTINDYFIFGNSEIALEYIVDHFKTENTLTNNKSFRNLSTYISNKSNLFYYINPGKTSNALKSKIINKNLISFDTDSIAKFTAFTLQINSTKNGMLHNICLFHDHKYKESIKEEWYFPLDTISTMDPQFVNNHFTKEKMILVQNNSNQLIALNSVGEKLWSIDISNKIIGDINYIDAYKNNKYQAIFNTNKQIYLIDRNGKNVEGFPKNIPYETSLGHGLFDYDNNKKYRIIIVGNNNIIYNLNKKGKKVSGWKFTKNSNIITQTPKHFISEGKDYILNATENSTTKLLARNGTDRVIFNDVYSFLTPIRVSKEGILYAITDKNNIWTGNVNGNSNIINLPTERIDKNSKIISYNGGYYFSSANALVYIKENKITEIQLDAQIVKMKEISSYVSIATEKSIYLLKDNKIIDGFPISSDMYFNISDIDNDGKINLVSIKKGFIYNYEITN